MIRFLLVFILIAQYSQAQISVNPQTGAKKSFEEIIAENKGKVILIDYWASWCKPCRKEMPEMRALMKKYKDANITFVFISMDIEADEWKKAAEKEKIVNMPYSYMSWDIKKTDLSRLIKVSSIPRYVIFNKDGNLVNADAPRPSEKELETELEKYLKM
ncbi:TlpA family protein disulfide reductase [Flavobacterium sp. RHBU_24]|uniref:TlpA family protein disulfide reductase n=1 Tax=Flavobacterium sp. RHBU_24 TaxID=3391185 RepID=UPI003984EDC3